MTLLPTNKRCLLIGFLAFIAPLVSEASEAKSALLYSFDHEPEVFTLEGLTFTAESVVLPDRVGWKLVGRGGDARHNLWPLLDLNPVFEGMTTAAIDIRVKRENKASRFDLVIENNYSVTPEAGLTLGIDLSALQIDSVSTVYIPLQLPLPALSEASTFKIKYYGDQSIDVEVYDFYLLPDESDAPTQDAEPFQS